MIDRCPRKKSAATTMRPSDPPSRLFCQRRLQFTARSRHFRQSYVQPFGNRAESTAWIGTEIPECSNIRKGGDPVTSSTPRRITIRTKTFKVASEKGFQMSGEVLPHESTFTGSTGEAVCCAV